MTELEIVTRVIQMWTQAKAAKPAKMGQIQWRKYRWAVCQYIAKEVGLTPEHVLAIVRRPSNNQLEQPSQCGWLVESTDALCTRKGDWHAAEIEGNFCKQHAFKVAESEHMNHIWRNREGSNVRVELPVRA